MQAVNFTSTDIKIHQAIRHEWESFQAWLSDQNREQEMLFVSQRRWGKMKAPDKQQILELQESARTEWLARVRQSQLHLEHWVMTPNEKQMLQQTLGWTPMDMVNAYAMEQAKMGPMYQRVDPGSWGTKEPGASNRRLMHSKSLEQRPAYAKWANEFSKEPQATASKLIHSRSPQHRPASTNRPNEHAKKANELPKEPRVSTGRFMLSRSPELRPASTKWTNELAKKATENSTRRLPGHRHGYATWANELSKEPSTMISRSMHSKSPEPAPAPMNRDPRASTNWFRNSKSPEYAPASTDWVNEHVQKAMENSTQRSPEQRPAYANWVNEFSKEPGATTSRFMRSKSPEYRPAYRDWANELSKEPQATTRRSMHSKSSELMPASMNWANGLVENSVSSPPKPPRSLRSVGLPGVPLYFVGVLLQGTDLDAIAVSDLETFAVNLSEEKIRQYYSEACEASLHLQRLRARKSWNGVQLR